MNYTWRFLLVLLSVASVCLAGGQVLVMATAGDVDSDLAEQVRSYLQDQCGAVVRTTAPVAVESGQSLDDIGRAAAQALGQGEFGVIVLARAEPDQPQGVCLPHERFGIINISRLEEGADRTTLIRRAGQDSLRVSALLLDMSTCPFPLCVLTGFERTEDLDRMSGNYCPPCQDRFTRLARTANLQLLEPKPKAEAAEDAEVPAEPEAHSPGDPE